MLRRTRLIRLAVVVLAGVVAASAPAEAQTSLQIPLQFDFLNPGAKSLALGGAFTGLADDATAPFANPAGLTQLLGPQLSVELRYARVVTPFLERGRLSGPISGEGIDTVQGPFFDDSAGSQVGPGFIAGVYTHSPYRWVVGGYRHELVRIDQTFFAQGVFQKDPTEFTSRRDGPQEGIRKVSVTSYVGAVAYRIHQGGRYGVHVGGTVTVSQFNIDSTFRRFDVEDFHGAAVVEREFGRSTQKGEDVSVVPGAGVLVVGRKMRIGFAYQRGATYTFETIDGPDPAREVKFRVPDTFAVGVAVQPKPVLTIAADVKGVTYGRLREDFIVDQARATGREESFDVSNGVELHVGVEYAVIKLPLAPQFRAGIWIDPDHSVQFTPSPVPGTVSDRLFDERLAESLSKGKTLVHWTGGVGLTIDDFVEFSVGADLTSSTRRVSASLIVHLPQPKKK